MTKQETVIKKLKQLKQLGISHKGFANAAKIPVDSIYGFTSYPYNMKEETADYLEHCIKKYFPVQWKIIQEMEVISFE